MTDFNELRIMARVARMYYQNNMSQAEIAKHMGISQPTVSRYLDRSRKEGIIRISLDLPKDVFTELEESLIMKYNLKDVVVIDSYYHDEKIIQMDLGAAASFYFESILRSNEILGIFPFSRTLLNLVETLRPITTKTGIKVVQILGGVGNPTDKMHVNTLVSRLAELVHGEAVFLPVTGIVATETARNILLSDDYVQHVTRLYDSITTCLEAIGAIVSDHPILQAAGNASFYMDVLKKNNAVGDLHCRFFDIEGNLIETGLEKRIISMDLNQLSKVERSICVAGGEQKYNGILGALRGKWINILITDRFTAERLISE